MSPLVVLKTLSERTLVPGTGLAVLQQYFSSFCRLFDKLSTYFDILLMQGNIEILMFTILFVKSCALTSVSGITGNNTQEKLVKGAEH